MMLCTAIVDKVPYTSKPNGEAQSISTRLSNSKNEIWELEDLCDMISKGHTVLPFSYQTFRSGKIKGRNNQFFHCTNMFMVDIDDGMDIPQMLELHYKLGLKPTFYYHSFSSNATHPKFRVGYVLPYKVYSEEEYRLIWATFDKFYLNGTILDKTKDLARMYYGSNQEVIICDDKPFDLGTLASAMGTLLDPKRIKLKDTKLVEPETFKNLAIISVQEMMKRSEIVRDFENENLRKEGDYHKVRSLAFVYYYMGLFDRFLELAPKNKSKYSVDKWKHDLEEDLKAGRTGHTHTFQVLQEIGAFNLSEVTNENIVKSNYLEVRLSELRCEKLEYDVDKYLPAEPIEKAIEIAKSGGRVLIIADTGTGKTYTTVNTLKRMKVKSIISVPNRMNAHQNMEKYNIAGAFAGYPISKAMSDNDIVCSVWESLSVRDIDYSQYILVNDEVHTHVHDSSFRSRSIRELVRLVPRFKGCIDITATPTGIDLSLYNLIIRFKSTKKIKYNVTIHVGYNETERALVFEQSKGKCLVLENRKKNLIFYKELLEKGLNSHIVTSDDKDTNPSFINIAKYERLLHGTKYLFCTTVLTAGVNILDDDITDICLVNFKSITTIKQFIARARNVKEMNIHIFLKETDRDYYTFNIYEERRFEAQILERRAHDIEVDIDRDLLDTEGSLRKNKLKRELELVEEDYQMLDEELWRKYYQHLSIANFKIALEEHFDNVSIDYKKYEQDEDAKEFRELLSDQEDDGEVFNFVNFMISKGCDESDLSNEEKLRLTGVSLSLAHIKKNNSRYENSKIFNKLKKLYPDIKPVNLDKVENYDQCKDFLDTYSMCIAEGFSHWMAVKVCVGDLDYRKIRDKITYLMFVSNRDKWKRGSPSYKLMNAIADKLPKNQIVSEETIRSICSEIDGKSYRVHDSYRSTLDDIRMIIPVEKVRRKNEYKVGSFQLDPIVTKEDVKRVEKSHILSSIDETLRSAIRTKMAWLDISNKYLDYKSKKS